jgi:hypothetical protein
MPAEVIEKQQQNTLLVPIILALENLYLQTQDPNRRTEEHEITETNIYIPPITFEGKTEEAKLAIEATDISNLDLEPIAYKIAHDEDGPDWSQDQIDTNINQYKAFFVLSFMFPEMGIVPTKAIDTVWHYHILDTAKYRTDCDKHLGFFLDHFPYFGLRGKEDEANMNNNFHTTANLLQTHFGIDLKTKKPKLCGTSCRIHECRGSDCRGDVKKKQPTSRPRPAR